jgi:hypothetical protein
MLSIVRLITEDTNEGTITVNEYCYGLQHILLSEV